MAELKPIGDVSQLVSELQSTYFVAPDQFVSLYNMGVLKSTDPGVESFAHRISTSYSNVELRRGHFTMMNRDEIALGKIQTAINDKWSIIVPLQREVADLKHEFTDGMVYFLKETGNNTIRGRVHARTNYGPLEEAKDERDELLTIEEGELETQQTEPVEEVVELALVGKDPLFGGKDWQAIVRAFGSENVLEGDNWVAVELILIQSFDTSFLQTMAGQLPR